MTDSAPRRRRLSALGGASTSPPLNVQRPNARRPAGGIGLNGCWNKCGVQLYQEGERVYYSALWKNAPGEWRAGWVIQRGEGWLRGQELYLHDVTWPSVLLNGAPSPKTEYYMRLSSDGNVLQGYAVVNGQKGPILTWTRDK